MKKACLLPLFGFALLLFGNLASAQTPYIGFTYPAGGQRGTTFQVRLGGQRLNGASGAVISGEGVTAKLVEYRRKLSNQEMTLLREQLRELKRPANRKPTRGKNGTRRKTAKAQPKLSPAQQALIARIEKRISEWVNRPQCAALAEIAILEVTIDEDAALGPHELRLITARGVTNPMVFYVGQVSEVARKPMLTCEQQVLGKEYLALRKRPPEEVEVRVAIPCTMNGQVGSGEVNDYRFAAHQGQKLVISVKGRELIPFIADAVPGWFQPVVCLYDADGNELAYNDDFRFNPDPTMYFEVPEDGEYRLSIHDAIYRGREDFVYRVTISQLPYITSIFPLGGHVGQPVSIEMKGWNLEGAELVVPDDDGQPGIQWITARNGHAVSNRLPFERGTLPELFDIEPNEDPQHAQHVEMPIVINGRIDQSDDWDVFEVQAEAGQTIVAEVKARCLQSPLDSLLKITDAAGHLLAVNDDQEDPGAGVNTHHADSYLRVKVPADGKYYIHIGDTDRAGSAAHSYRLRISHPQPDFDLRVVPSYANFRSRGSAPITVHVLRKDGFSGNVTLRLKDPPTGFLARDTVLKGDKDLLRVGLRTTLTKLDQPVKLVVEGVAKIGGEEVVHQAVPAEDQMQAFLWRHLVPAEDLVATIYNPSYKPPQTRVPKANASLAKKVAEKKAEPPKFNKRQVAGRLRQLNALYQEWLLTDAFYSLKVAECETVLD